MIIPSGTSITSPLRSMRMLLISVGLPVTGDSPEALTADSIYRHLLWAEPLRSASKISEQSIPL